MKKENRKRSFIGNVLFCSMLLAAVLLIYRMVGTETGAPRSVFGYSIFSVLTTSMDSEIPKGSFVATKKVDEATIQVGDDITFLHKNDTTITHRVIAVYEDYQGSGMRGFQTKGVDNSVPDEEIVLAVNVVGVVVGHISLLGDLLTAVTSNLELVLVFLTLLFTLFFCLRVYFRERRKEKI